MKIILAEPEREQSRGEEIANSISHGIGLVSALVATPFLIMHAGLDSTLYDTILEMSFGSRITLLYFLVLPFSMHIRSEKYKNFYFFAGLINKSGIKKSTFFEPDQKSNSLPS